MLTNYNSLITIHNLLFRTMMTRFEARAQDRTVPATFLRASLKIIPLFERTFYNFGYDLKILH